ncbi:MULTISPECIES: DUF433 domain-containing protein [unclassified Siphonobacter]|uniref:DUF433 domain-containing protein n=1 Tax=unclassified Siphonobacter TaxID=2635712 RepID=UPI000CB35F7D|nr:MULTISPECIES: DUF433 domain-containing protein [unclassified Siphonobacter]MDQ1086956.1 uncharacterized protein (DUF433 family) [Siphonobacter sp. SORGH_AS_1065]PKK35660.1 hypothetical protein BWI96_15210 [Siphonobacter sp. SORGH_AS_0500]
MQAEEIQSIEPALDMGIYTVPDVAQILRLPLTRVRRWLDEFWNGRLSNTTKVSYSWGKGRERVVNFQTLIEFYVFFKLRELGISTAKILQAHEVSSKLLQTPFPFASSFLLTDSKTLFVEIGNEILITADARLQYEIKEVMEGFCRKIEFDTDKVAAKFWPLGKDRSVVIDPQKQFGQPIIQGTNILAETLHRIHLGGEEESTIASLYQITPQQVEEALYFINRPIQ